MEEEIQQNQDKLQKALESIIWATAAIVEARDPYTAGHQERVTNLSLVVCSEMQISEEEKQETRMAAIVHDIGKVTVPSEILSKPGRLNEIEFSMIKTHSQAGYDIFQNVELPWPIADIILQHHERLDGSGYPNGLKNKDILLPARIIAVADVIEAMTSHRPYRPALGIYKALEEISRNKGKLYDSEVVDAFLNLFQEQELPVSEIAKDNTETIARAIHEDYLITQRDKSTKNNLSLKPWDDLPYHLRDSSWQQAEHILRKLNRIGCTVHKTVGDDIKMVNFSENEVEVLAEMEHQRWKTERTLGGWVAGEIKNTTKKISPYLVPSSELPDEIKELDRQMVRNIPGLLARVGLEIHRQSSDKDGITNERTSE